MRQLRTLSWWPGTRTLRMCCLTRSSRPSSAIAPACFFLAYPLRCHLDASMIMGLDRGHQEGAGGDVRGSTAPSAEVFWSPYGSRNLLNHWLTLVAMPCMHWYRR